MAFTPNSGFFDKLQEDGINMAVLIDLLTPTANFFWTTQNDDVITSTFSGDMQQYTPFPGEPSKGPAKGTDLLISTVRFIVANSGNVFDALIIGKELPRSDVIMRRYFVDTPGLGTMPMLCGRLSNFAWDRNEIAGAVRDSWNSALQRWPYYNWQDGCIWKFGSPGCGFDTSSVTITTSIDVASSTAISVLCVSGSLTQSYANGFFDFGRFDATGGVNSGSVRTVRAHSGDLLLMSHPFGASVESLEATVFPGCRKRRIIDCRSKYDNEVNFFGNEWTPIQEDGF